MSRYTDVFLYTDVVSADAVEKIGNVVLRSDGEVGQGLLTMAVTRPLRVFFASVNYLDWQCTWMGELDKILTHWECDRNSVLLVLKSQGGDGSWHVYSLNEKDGSGWTERRR